MCLYSKFVENPLKPAKMYASILGIVDIRNNNLFFT